MHAPPILYGTAWKEDRSEALVYQALKAGFRGIDTANQRKHYFEAGVGRGIQRFLQDTGTPRDDLFLQTKFTYQRGQDHRLPYDPEAELAEQVHQSVDSSLAHLGTSWLDALVLHGPSRGRGLGPDDVDVWQAMEDQVDKGVVRHLGVSNIRLEQLMELRTIARIQPRYVQNRCYARLGWDRAVRTFCSQHSMVYQGFSLLTANPEVFQATAFRRLVADLGVTPAQAIFAFAGEVGMLPLTGTTSPQHLAEDLGAMRLTLSADDVATIDQISG
jgi:diketogulonate reductase-like aldo/keto reductase